jgi:hypothetical protein
MSTSDDSTRPISVAELLARNGTIGSPPVGGHRRRKRIGGLTVAELTGEIPIYQTGEMPVVRPDEVDRSDDIQAEPDAAVSSETGGYPESVSYADEATVTYAESGVVESGYADTAVVYSSASEPETYSAGTYAAETYVSETYVSESYTAEATYAPETYAPVTYVSEQYADQAYTQPSYGTETYVEAQSYGEEITPAVAIEPGPVLELADEPVVSAASDARPITPPKSRNPLPRRVRGLQRSHDPRPQRRTAEQPRSVEATTVSGAEQMNYDPVDVGVNLTGLVGDKPDGVEELRTYLQSSSGTLFSGETIADDLARRVVEVPSAAPVGPSAKARAKPGKAPAKASLKNGAKNKPMKTLKASDKTEAKAKTQSRSTKPRESRATALSHALVAVLQSMLAVAFGGGLFIAFDQLWRWNNIVALVLSVLVILGLVVGVRVVRKTEDIASTLIAVVVGALVTLGPLALLQST